MMLLRSLCVALLPLFIGSTAFSDYESDCRQIHLEFTYYLTDWLGDCLSWSKTWDTEQMTKRLGGSAFAVTLLSLKIENAHRACTKGITAECLNFAKQILQALPPPAAQTPSSLKEISPTQDLVSRLELQIKKHEPAPLSYATFSEMIKDGRLNANQANALIDYAYSVKNPIIFRKAEKLVSPDEYSLNFLWIHKDKILENGHMFGRNDSRLQDQVIRPIADWQSKQPEARINFWYDGAIVDHQRLDETKKYLRDKTRLNLARIAFRDIRSIPLLKEHAKWFDTAIPVYFRVDFAKAVIADHVLRNDKLPFVVNIDSDVVAIVREQLFDKPTLEALSSLGYVFGGTPGAAEENSFIMHHQTHNTNILALHLDRVILAGMKRYEVLKANGMDDFYLAQSVFEQYEEYRNLVKSNYEKRKGVVWGKEAQNNGKPMILPNSRYSIGLFAGGYSEEMIARLRSALLAK